MTLQLIAALVGLGVLSGCAATHVRLPAKMVAPDIWRTPPNELPMSASGNKDPEWWKLLADPELNRFIALALEDNSDIRIASVRIQQARALTVGAVAEQRPNLSSNFEIRRERVQGTRAKDADGVTVRISPSFRKQISTQIVEATYEVDLLGRLALAARASEAELLATKAEHRAVRLWAAHEVVVAYTDTRLAEVLLLQASREIEFAMELLAAERAKREAGLSTGASVRAVEDELADAHKTLTNLERSRSLGLARLALVLGKAPAELVWPPVGDYFTRFLKTNTGAIDADLPAAVLDRRPDVIAAWHRVVAFTTDAERARLEKYPNFTLTGSAGFLSQTLRRWLMGDAFAWVVGAALHGPLLDGGQVKARTDAAAAIAAERQMEYRKVVLQALNEVEAALTEAVFARERLRIAESTLSRRVADTTAASDLLRQGVGDRLALLRAERAGIEAHQGVTMRRHDLLLAWASVQKTLGR